MAIFNFGGFKTLHSFIQTLSETLQNRAQLDQAFSEVQIFKNTKTHHIQLFITNIINLLHRIKTIGHGNELKLVGTFDNITFQPSNNFTLETSLLRNYIIHALNYHRKTSLRMFAFYLEMLQ